MSFAHFGTQSIVAFLRLGRIFSDSLMIIVRLFPSEGIPHPSAHCHQRRLLYLVDHEFWPLGQFLCGDHQILALQHLLNLRSLHPVCADCCFVSPGQGPRDWVGTVLRTVFCCWPCYRCWRNQEPKFYHCYEYGRTRQFFMLRQSSQHLSSAESLL